MHPKETWGTRAEKHEVWKLACIAKLVWDIAKKKDGLWIHWIHGRYIKDKGCWEYTSRNDASWYWKMLLIVKDKFRFYPKEDYKVKEGYARLCQTPITPTWSKIIWTRLSIPRHSLTAWMLMHQRLPVLCRMGRYTNLPSTDYRMCHQSIET